MKAFGFIMLGIILAVALAAFIKPTDEVVETVDKRNSGCHCTDKIDASLIPPR